MECNQKKKTTKKTPILCFKPPWILLYQSPTAALGQGGSTVTVWEGGDFLMVLGNIWGKFRANFTETQP